MTQVHRIIIHNMADNSRTEIPLFPLQNSRLYQVMGQLEKHPSQVGILRLEVLDNGGKSVPAIECMYSTREGSGKQDAFLDFMSILLAGFVLEVMDRVVVRNIPMGVKDVHTQLILATRTVVECGVKDSIGAERFDDMQKWVAFSLKELPNKKLWAGFTAVYNWINE